MATSTARDPDATLTEILLRMEKRIAPGKQPSEPSAERAEALKTQRSISLKLKGDDKKYFNEGKIVIKTDAAIKRVNPIDLGAWRDKIRDLAPKIDLP